MTTTNPPLSDYSTQQARSDELRRRKLRRDLVTRWGTAHATTTTAKLAALRRISTEQWKAAQDNGDTDAA